MSELNTLSYVALSSTALFLLRLVALWTAMFMVVMHRRLWVIIVIWLAFVWAYVDNTAYYVMSQFVLYMAIVFGFVMQGTDRLGERYD